MRLRLLLVNAIIMRELVPISWRSILLRRLGFNIGARTYIASGCRFKGVSLSTGTDCFINHDNYIDSGEVTIGSGVFIGPGCTLISRDHALGGPERRAGDNRDTPIRIGSGSWIGANVTVLGDVTIESGVVVAAGAVVTGDLSSNGIYGGVPARLIRKL
ncbi:acyltransferase [Terrabacter sp. RAF57]|uniref:acyltransferase n=1 Tax=Terrabacter sp. RAF57 TaxID=3233063 RepID=UPI003F97A800